jgi:hypothetical protein
LRFFADLAFFFFAAFAISSSGVVFVCRRVVQRSIARRERLHRTHPPCQDTASRFSAPFRM